MTITAIENAMADLIQAEENANVVSAKKKPRAAKAAEVKEPKAPKPEKVVVEPVLYKGFEVSEGADLKTLEAFEKSAQDAIAAITNKESDLLGHYIALGGFQSQASGMFKSTKLYGQYLKQELPASQLLDAALRSNCKWLFEAISNKEHEASDILSVLGVNRLEDFKSGNPTVIKREYKERQKQQAVAELAEASGLSVEEQEAALVAEAQAAKESEKAAMVELLQAFVESIAKRPTKKEVAADAADVISEFLFSKRADAIEMMKSCLVS